MLLLAISADLHMFVALDLLEVSNDVGADRLAEVAGVHRASCFSLQRLTAASAVWHASKQLVS